MALRADLHANRARTGLIRVSRPTSFFCFNLSPQDQAVIYVEHGNLD